MTTELSSNQNRIVSLAKKTRVELERAFTRHRWAAVAMHAARLRELEDELKCLGVLASLAVLCDWK